MEENNALQPISQVNDPNPPVADQTMPLGPQGIGYLRQCGRWMKFLAILGAVGVALMFICGLTVLLMGNLMEDYVADTAYANFPMQIVGVIYLALCGVCIIPLVYMFRYSKWISVADQTRDADSLEYALQNMKSLWKFCGIFAIVLLAIYVLLIITALLVLALNM